MNYSMLCYSTDFRDVVHKVIFRIICMDISIFHPFIMYCVHSMQFSTTFNTWFLPMDVTHPTHFQNTKASYHIEVNSLLFYTQAQCLWSGPSQPARKLILNTQPSRPQTPSPSPWDTSHSILRKQKQNTAIRAGEHTTLKKRWRFMQSLKWLNIRLQKMKNYQNGKE